VLFGIRRAAAIAVVAALSVGACGSDSPTTRPFGSGSAVSGATSGAAIASGVNVVGAASPSPGSTTPGPSPASTAAALPAPSGAFPTSTPLAVVTGFDNYALNAISTKSLGERIRAGRVLVPCGAEQAIAASL